MRAICVDDEALAVENTLGLCALLPEIDEAKGFTDPLSALDWLRTHPVDVALLDIHMPEMDGITLAARIKQLYPRIAVLFLTAFKDYAFEAFAVRPVSYLLKPVSLERLAEELRYAFRDVRPRSRPPIQIKTFGNFDVYVDDRLVSFRLAKSKELLAYLVDKQGSGVTRAELFAAVWEDRLYDRKQQKQLDVYIRSLRQTLREYGAAEIMEMEKGVLRIRPETFSCDAYRFYSGDSDAINSYRGEYMSSYSWASLTEGILSWNAGYKD